MVAVARRDSRDLAAAVSAQREGRPDMIKTQDAIRLARSMIGTPYSEIDCIEAQALYTALMTDTLIEEV